MQSSSYRSRASSSGFTIIELLVAVGVTAILVTLMLTITLNVLGAWNRSSGKLSANATARLVLDQLSQDLSSAIMRRDGNVWLAATVQQNQTTAAGDSGMTSAHWTAGTRVKPLAANGSLKLTGADVKSIEDCRFGQAGTWLRLFTVLPAKNDGTLVETSAPRAVGWQLIRRQIGSTVGSAQFSYQLFRSEVRPFASDNGSTATDESADNVFAAGYDLYMSAASTVSYNNGDNGNTQQSGDVGNIRRPHSDQLIGVNVVDFGVKFYERNGAALVETFPGASPPATVPFSYAACSVARNLATTGTSVVGFPVEAEIMIRVLSPDGARELAAFEDGSITRPATFANDDDYWWDIVVRNSDVFTRRVEIKAQAL